MIISTFREFHYRKTAWFPFIPLYKSVLQSSVSGDIRNEVGDEARLFPFNKSSKLSSTDLHLSLRSSLVYLFREIFTEDDPSFADDAFIVSASTFDLFRYEADLVTRNPFLDAVSGLRWTGLSHPVLKLSVEVLLPLLSLLPLRSDFELFRNQLNRKLSLVEWRLRLDFSLSVSSAFCCGLAGHDKRNTVLFLISERWGRIRTGSSSTMILIGLRFLSFEGMVLLLFTLYLSVPESWLWDLSDKVILCFAIVEAEKVLCISKKKKTKVYFEHIFRITYHYLKKFHRKDLFLNMHQSRIKIYLLMKLNFSTVYEISY